MNRLIVEIDLRHIVHVVMQFWLDEVVGDHRVPHLAFQLDAIVGEHFEVVLQILSDFQDLGVFVHFFEYINNSQRFFTFGGNGHVECLKFLHGEA